MSGTETERRDLEGISFGTFQEIKKALDDRAKNMEQAGHDAGAERANEAIREIVVAWNDANDRNDGEGS